MEKYSIESLIVDENELAEHYKEAGNEYGYKGKSKLVEYLKELKTYKDAEEQGLLLKLPCKVRDKVFVLTGLEDDNIVHEGKCVGYTKNELRGWLIEVNYFGGYKSFESFAEIGKSVFLTKEEAEQALAEMEGE